MTTEQWIMRRPEAGFITTKSGKIHSVHIVYECGRQGSSESDKVVNAYYASDCSAVAGESGRGIVGGFTTTQPEVTNQTSVCLKCAAVLAERAKLDPTKK